MRLQAQWNHVRFSILGRSSLNSCLTFTASSFVGHRSTTANRPMPLDDFDIFTEEFWKSASLEGVKFVWKSDYITVPWIKIESVLWSSSSHNTCVVFDNPKKFHTKITDHEAGACFLRLIIRHIGCQKCLSLFKFVIPSSFFFHGLEKKKIISKSRFFPLVDLYPRNGKNKIIVRKRSPIIKRLRTCN